jgi:hypothetical protein
MKLEDDDHIPAIESLVDAFETRRLSRRELVASLAALVATGASASAQVQPVQQISQIAQGGTLNHVSLAGDGRGMVGAVLLEAARAEGGEPSRQWPGLEWATFLVMRRTFASLSKAIGINAHTRSAQMGNTADVIENEYAVSSFAERLAAVRKLESSVVIN